MAPGKFLSCNFNDLPLIIHSMLIDFYKTLPVKYYKTLLPFDL